VSSERRGAQRREHILGGDAHAWIDQQGRQARQSPGRRQHLADPAHHPGLRIEAHRDIGAGRARRRHEAGIVERDAVVPREQPQRCGGIGRAAADPRRNGQPFRQDEAADLEALAPLAKRAHRLEHEIVGDIACSGCGRAAHS
jgi:hypothetical protein